MRVFCALTHAGGQAAEHRLVFCAPVCGRRPRGARPFSMFSKFQQYIHSYFYRVVRVSCMLLVFTESSCPTRTSPCVSAPRMCACVCLFMLSLLRLSVPRLACSFFRARPSLAVVFVFFCPFFLNFFQGSCPCSHHVARVSSVRCGWCGCGCGCG